MKKKIINIFITISIITTYYLISNHNLYNNYYLEKKIVLKNNEEKVITIKNKSSKKYIYNFYISKKSSFNKVFVNNKEISNSYIKDNNYIIYKLLLKSKESKTILFNIVGNKKYEIYIERIKYNKTLIKHIKDKSSKKAYFIDTDNAKELYRFKDSYKYIGNVSNNYIYFNCNNNSLLSCELYRIIGIDKNNYIKIIKSSYENIDKNNYNIYERNKYLIKDSNIEILKIDDYIDSFRKVSSRCVNNIYKCNKKSYLTPSSYELVEQKKRLLTISYKGNVLRNKKTNLYRPVLYLKKEVIITGGDGSINRPYIIK